MTVALSAAIALTRRVDGLVKTLGIESLSKSQVSRMLAEVVPLTVELGWLSVGDHTGGV